MSTNKKATSSSSFGDARAEKSLDKLTVRKFSERFYIPNGVLVGLMDGEVTTTEKSEDNAIFFYKGAIQCWAPVPTPVAVQGISSLHPDSSGLHPSKRGPGANGMQHSKHVVQSRPLAVGGSFRLFS